MGLGLLFIGYVLLSLFTYAPTFFITDFVGVFIMYEALLKLRRHAPRFKYALMSVYALFAVVTMQCVYYLLNYVGIIELVSTVTTAIEIGRLVATLVFTVAMLLALEQLARSVGDNKLADRCKRNMWYYVLSFALSLSLSFDFDFLESYISAFSQLAFLFKLLCAFLVPAVIYSSYMWICLESDHDMNKKRDSKVSGFFSKLKSGGKNDITKEDLKKQRNKK